MEVFTELRGINKNEYNCYRIKVTDNMKEKALDFSEKIILSDNQYNRLLPTKIIGYSNVDEDLILRIQRTYDGKIGEHF